MSKKNPHVVPRGDKWAVQKAGGERATRVVDTQAEAIRIARDIAQKDQSELIIHSQNGRINRRDSFGNDPFPPAG